MPYRFKKVRKYPPPEVRPRKRDGLSDTPQEFYVHGKKASDLEYYFAQALEKFGHDFIFKYIARTPYTLPGEANELDFMVDRIYPYEIDGEYSHKSAQQRAYDAARDARISNFLLQKGIQPITRVKDTLVDTQEKADNYVQENV